MSVLDPLTDDEYEKWVHSLSEGVNSRAIRRLKSFMSDAGWSSVANKPHTPRQARQRKRRLLLIKRKRKEGTKE